MKPAPAIRKFRLISLLLVTALMLLPSLYCGPGLNARAQSQPPMPEAGQDFYYNDQANVLSEETRALILTKNAALAQYSVQLVVYTTGSLPVTGYTQRVDYLRELMQSWQVGGKDGRGLLLALSVSDGDYLAIAGEGLQEHFTADLLKSILDAQLEPDFAAGAYDAGVSKFVLEAAAQAETFAASAPVSTEPQPRDKESGPSILLWVALAAGAVAVICIAVFILSGRLSRRRSTRRGVHRHAPLVTPPRTNVLRHESHTPIIVKSASRGGGPTRVKKL